MLRRERKKSHDKVYPKGYVEMLEQQQEQLVSGLQEMYFRMRIGKPWSGPMLSVNNGHPLTHDILGALGLLQTKHDGSGELETFEEIVGRLQSRLIADGAKYVSPKRLFLLRLGIQPTQPPTTPLLNHSQHPEPSQISKLRQKLLLR